MLKAIFLDMDDTLIVNQVLYDHARHALSGYLSHFGIPAKETETFVDRIDAELYKTQGVSRSRYPQTFENTLRHFVPNADAEMVSIVRNFAESVFNTVAAIKPGTQEAIDMLSGYFDLYVLTAGDKSVQEARISHLPFKDKITDVHIVDKKDMKAYSDALAASGVKPAEALMIGDSLKSDVIPAVAAGMSAILIDAKTWNSFNPHHHGEADFPPERAYKFSSLLEAARHIVRHGSPAPVDEPVRAKPKNKQPKGP